jgi:hypothetical protein
MQLLILYLRPNFGLDIEKWNIKGLVKLFENTSFCYKTIIKIAKGIKLSINDISILVIINIFLTGNNTYMKYKYNEWLNELNNYTNEVNELSKHNFKKIIKNMINEKYIIDINNGILCYYNLYIKELEISNILINIQYNRDYSIINKFKCNINSIKDFIINKNCKCDNLLDNEQQQSIINIFEHRISIINGHVGSSKSSILKALIKSLNEFELKTDYTVYFLTPTAIAMQYMKQILDNISKYIYNTLHAFILKYSNNIFKLNNNLNIFIIEESSMVDINLLYDFLTLIQNYNVIIIFLGDYNKLLSTGPGNIFKDMISSKKIPTTTLNNTYKYDTKLVLKDIINKINNSYEINKLDYNNLTEFELIITYNYNNIDNIIEDECKKYDIIIAITNNIIKKYTNIIRDIKNPKNKQIEYNNNIYID